MYNGKKSQHFAYVPHLRPRSPNDGLGASASPVTRKRKRAHLTHKADYDLLRIPPSGEARGLCLFHAPSGQVLTLTQIDSDLFSLVMREDG